MMNQIENYQENADCQALETLTRHLMGQLADCALSDVDDSMAQTALTIANTRFEEAIDACENEDHSMAFDLVTSAIELLKKHVPSFSVRLPLSNMHYDLPITLTGTRESIKTLTDPDFHLHLKDTKV